MNNVRRKKIAMIINDLESIKSKIENINDEEQDYFDNMPENLQGSINGMNSEDAIDILNDAIDSISEAIDGLEGI